MSQRGWALVGTGGGGTQTMGDTKAGAEDPKARFPPPQCPEVGVLNQERVSGAQARSEERASG